MNKSGILGEPKFIGRQKELEELQSYLKSVIEGKGQTVFISGEAGSGKTRLINEFLGEVKKMRVVILTGWCLSNIAVPYFPFYEAFRKYFKTKNRSYGLDIEDLFINPHEKRGNSHSTNPQIWKDQTFTAIATAIDSISRKKPVLLFIDDLHWADSASLALIHYLSDITKLGRVLVIATYRTEQIASERGRQHPLVETLRLMRRQDLIREINLFTLDEINVTQLAKSMLGGNLEQEFAQKLTKESQGNPLFVIESIRMLNETKNLIQEHNKWHLINNKILIPPKIRDIIMQRMESLLDYQKKVLQVASIIGERFDPRLLSGVFGNEPIEIIEILDKVANETCLVQPAKELYRFDHARTREAIYDDLSSALKKEYHEKIAQNLETKIMDVGSPFSDIAFHYIQAGNNGEAVKYAMIAGQGALSRWSNKEAIEHFTFVVRAVETKPEYVKERIIALEGLGDAYYADDKFEQAVLTYGQLAETQSGASRLRALRKAIRAASYQGDISIIKALIQNANEIETGDRLEVARILYEKAVAVMGGGNDWVTALKLSEDALQVFNEELAISDAASVLPLTGYIAANLGYLERGIVAAIRSIALCVELGDFRSQIYAEAYAGGTFQTCLLKSVSDRTLAKAVELNEQHKIWDYVRIIPAYVWWSAGLVGVNVSDSISKVLKALEYSEKTDSRVYIGAMYGVLTIAYALAEDKINVDKYYGKLMSLPKHILSNGPTQVYLGKATGVFYATEREFEKSNQYFKQLLTVAKSLFQNPFIEVSTRQLFAWALGKQGKIDEAKSQLKQAQEIIEIIQKRFSSVNIQPCLMTFSVPEVNQTFLIRLEVINVSSSQGKLLKIENLLVPEFKLLDISSNCLVRNSQFEFKNNEIGPFEIKTVTLTVQATQPGEFHLTPSITYVNELGEIKKQQIFKTVAKLTPQQFIGPNISYIDELVKIVVKPGSSIELKVDRNVGNRLSEFEFKIESAKEAFDFLLNSFAKDYMYRRLPLEWSGWRTMMDIVKNARISKRMVYGPNGRNGLAISELERRGLVEIRFFPGERGRGGRVKKVRVSYEKEPITRLVDEKILRVGKNK
jgi:tetratricopeptide (TPR) repeat protein